MRIKQIRIAKGLSQEDLAERSGTTQATISRVESGFDGVTLKVLKDIADALDVDISDLFNDRNGLEAVLISAFRSLSEERQLGWIDMARLAIGQQTATTK